MTRKRIFLAHARPDKAQVRTLYEQLQMQGFDPWLDEVDIAPGTIWRDEIRRAIRSAAIFLACLSTRSISSGGFIHAELRYALSTYAERPPGTIYLIPVRFDNCDVPDLSHQDSGINLREFQWIDLFKEGGFERLVEAIDHARDDGTESEEDGPLREMRKTFIQAATTEELLDLEHELEAYLSANPTSSDARNLSERLRVARSRQHQLERGAASAAPRSHPTVPKARRGRFPVWYVTAGLMVTAAVVSALWLPSIKPTDKEGEGITDPAPPPNDADTTADPSDIEPSGSAEATTARDFATLEDFGAFQDCDHCPEMVMLPAGTFLMGSPPEEQGPDQDEGPQHEVTITQRFAIGKYEMTFDEYDRFAGITNRELPDDIGWGRGRRPVVSVSWHDAKAYCDWLSQETGGRYRLPSEAEWEYAARAGTTTPYATGASLSPGDANTGSILGGAAPIILGGDGGRTREVGSYASNPWGLHDMHGNVWEWVLDWYGPYAAGSAADPLGPESGGVRVTRGGSYFDIPLSARSSARTGLRPENIHDNLGFRCVRAE